MTSEPTFWKPHLHNYSIAILCIAYAAVVVFSVDSIQLTYDSHDYLKASEGIETYLHHANADGITLLHRLPLLPLLLHFFENKTEAARYLNLICLAASLILLYQIGKNIFDDRLIRFFPLCATAFSLPWLQNHLFLWTEPLFSALILVGCYLILIEAKMIWVILVCSAAFFLKAAGVFLTAAVIFHLLISKHYFRAVTLAVVVIILYFSWEFISLAYSGTSRSASIISYLGSLSRAPYFDALSSWWLPRVVPVFMRCVILGATVACILYVIRNRVQDLADHRNKLIVLIVAAIIPACYITLFGIPDYFEAERYLSVVLPLAMVVMFALVEKLVATQPRLRIIVLVGAVLWLFYPIIRTINYLWL